MKKLVLVALIATLLTPTSAQAAETKFVGGPLTNLDYQNATINITLTDVPTKGGLYIQQCVEAPAGTRYNAWISTGINRCSCFKSRCNTDLSFTCPSVCIKWSADNTFECNR
ncbi:MAG: hypothetical protein EB049_06750 [Actinobacteria bacterium]|nr:hypothetical protein [Actinomycetota bacterium]